MCCSLPGWVGAIVQSVREANFRVLCPINKQPIEFGLFSVNTVTQYQCHAGLVYVASKWGVIHTVSRCIYVFHSQNKTGSQFLGNLGHPSATFCYLQKVEDISLALEKHVNRTTADHHGCVFVFLDVHDLLAGIRKD